MSLQESDPLLAALTDLVGKRRRSMPAAVPELRIISGKVDAVNTTDDLVDVLSGDIVYEGLPSLVPLAINDVVFWLNTGSGGLVLGKKAAQ